MTSRGLYAIPLLLAIGFCLMIAIPVSAEVEPNDSLLTPEVIGEGTFNGSVSMNGTVYTDKDYFRISVPSKKDIEITLTKTDMGFGTIDVNSYDENRNPMSILFGGIWISVSTAGTSQTDTWYNEAGSAKDFYLEVEGDGEYRMDIRFTTETQDFEEAVGSVCLVFTIVSFLIILFIVGLIIFFIIFFKKKDKKKKASEPGVQITTDILRSEVVEVPPQQQPAAPPQPQYPPQQPQYQPQQPATPPPAQPPQQQQPAAPPPQQPATPPPAQPPQQAPAVPPQPATPPPPQAVPPPAAPPQPAAPPPQQAPAAPPQAPPVQQPGQAPPPPQPAAPPPPQTPPQPTVPPEQQQ
jgi:hypothetical protein